MSGNKIFIDTNIAIYLLDGDTSLAEILNQKHLYLSLFITQLELLGYQGLTKQQEQQIEYMLENSVVIDINNKIKQEVIKLRRNYNIKLPDCIVAATAMYLDLPLITADKGFNKIEELNLMLYEK
jgi:predicted nucleic acid-binding protein